MTNIKALKEQLQAEVERRAAMVRPTLDRREYVRDVAQSYKTGWDLMHQIVKNKPDYEKITYDKADYALFKSELPKPKLLRK